MKINTFARPQFHLGVTLIVFAFLYTAQAWAQNSGNCIEECNWYSTIFPLCQNQNNGWGWENSASCIGRQTCESQWGDGGVIENCDNNGDQDAALCASIDGLTYYSDALFVMGLFPSGRINGHREVSFRNGELNATHSDMVVTASYHCENGKVIASQPEHDNTALDLSDDLNTLNFDVFSDSTPVTYSLSTEANANCSYVANTPYIVAPNESASGAFSIRFAQGTSAQMNIPTGTYNNAVYDCNTGELHIHKYSSDSNPIIASIEDDGAAIVAQLDESTNWRFLREEDSACTTEYAPVCSLVPMNIPCVTSPCPAGEFKTFSNRCESDKVDARFFRVGECGDLEGDLHYEHDICTAVSSPVCAAIAETEPCLSSPCPIQKYKTFSSPCHMDGAGASLIRGGKCDSDEGHRIFDLSAENLVCPDVFAPVCAKDEANVVCVTTPCNTHVYKSFGNSCEASVAVSDIAWPHQSCGALEDLAVTEQPPVHIVNTLGTTDKQPLVLNARIEDEILYVTLGYTGCSEQHFDFQVKQAFVEGEPVQAHWAFIPQIEDPCVAAVQSDLRYDLRPLRVLYEEVYGADPATITLPGLGDYKINGNACDLPFSSNGTSISLDTVNWSTGDIDISCSSGVNISMLAQGLGPMESADYLNIYYRLDGGPKVVLSNNTNAFSRKTVSANNISGSTLEIIVEGRTSYADETYTISNIRVTSGG